MQESDHVFLLFRSENCPRSNTNRDEGINSKLKDILSKHLEGKKTQKEDEACCEQGL